MEQSPPVEFGRKLFLLRTGLGHTQKQLAAVAGLRQATLSMIENGHNSPKHQTLVCLAQAFGMADLGEFFAALEEAAQRARATYSKPH